MIGEFTKLLRDENLVRLWGEVEPAPEREALPPGEYTCDLICGELTASPRGTPCYKLTFQVVDGEYAGRKLWHDIWLTPSAIAHAKRDLGRLGITALEQLRRPVPRGIRCVLQVTRRTSDSGAVFNRVARFVVREIVQPEADPFAPTKDVEGTP